MTASGGAEEEAGRVFFDAVGKVLMGALTGEEEVAPSGVFVAMMESDACGGEVFTGGATEEEVPGSGLTFDCSQPIRNV